MQSSTTVEGASFNEAALVTGTENDGNKASENAPVRTPNLLLRATAFVSLHLIFVGAGLLLYSS